MSSDEEFLAAILGALEAAGLEAIVVGMTAAVLQDVPAMTQDVDLLVRDTPRNREKIGAFCDRLGVVPVEPSPLSRVVTLVGAIAPIDILFDEIAGSLSFAALRSRGVEIKVGNHVAVAASLEDIIRSKTAAGRPKDLAQLPILRATLRVKQALESGT